MYVASCLTECWDCGTGSVLCGTTCCCVPALPVWKDRSTHSLLLVSGEQAFFCKTRWTEKWLVDPLRGSGCHQISLAMGTGVGPWGSAVRYLIATLNSHWMTEVIQWVYGGVGVPMALHLWIFNLLGALERSVSAKECDKTFLFNELGMRTAAGPVRLAVAHRT